MIWYNTLMDKIEKIEIDACYNLDCNIGMQLMKEQGLIADCLLTDIPYGEINRSSNGLRQLDKREADEETFSLGDFLENAERVVRGVFIIFCGTEQVSEIRKFFVEHDCTTRLLIWEKTNPSPMNGDKFYLSGVECAVYAKRSGATFNGFCKNTVFRKPTVQSDIHPTMKPLSLWYELLRDNTNEGQLVLDTCMGSFTTAIACHKLSRHWIGFELNKEFYKSGYERYKTSSAQISLFD